MHYGEPKGGCMEIKKIDRELQHAPVDDGANIKLVKLTGDKMSSVFAAEIAPQTVLNPHYHQHGIEIYQVLKGKGIMKVGKMHNDSIHWDETAKVEEGDFFSIEAGKIHQIQNDSNKPLVAVFTCPEEHLTGDRYFV